jgi:hypothetical protein
MYPVAPRPEQRRDRGAAGPEAGQAPEAAAAAPGCRGVRPAGGTGNSGGRHQQPPCAPHPTESGPRPASLAPEAAPIWRVHSRSRQRSGTGRSGGAPGLRRRTSARCCDPHRPDKAERSPGHTQPRPSAMSPTRTIAPRVEGGVAARGAGSARSGPLWRPRRSSPSARRDRATLRPRITELEMSGSGCQGGSGSRVSPVWPRNPVMSAGCRWMRSSWCRIAAASWSVVPAARLPRPFFITGQAPSTALRSGA